MNQSNPMDIPRLTQLPSFTYRSSFNHTCSLQYLCRSRITTRSYTAKSFHNTGRRMIRMMEYLFTCSGTKNGRRDDYWTVPTHWSSRSCAQHITRISLYESLLSINVYGHISSTYKYSGFTNKLCNTFLMQFFCTEVNDTNDHSLTRFRIGLGFITSSNRHIDTHWISTVPRSSYTGDWNFSP